jgi:N-acetylneuraminate synthase
VNDVFDHLFVLELARNHWGSVPRGREIIRQYAAIVKKHGVRAAIKLQAFDTDTFIHKDFLPEGNEPDGEEIHAPGSASRYIKKTLATRLSPEEFAELAAEIRRQGLLSMVTPYDEASVDLCSMLDFDIYKLASSDTGSATLLQKVVALGKPLSISTGVPSLEAVDRVVLAAERANIPLAINYCVSNYPSKNSDLKLNQISFFKERYPRHTIGFSAHDHTDIALSHAIAYTKGARTFERHIDIEDGDYSVSAYCLTPEKADAWLAAHRVIVEMAQGPSDRLREVTNIERGYIKSVNRGAYALRALPKGAVITAEGLGKDFYLAIPLADGQLSSSDLAKPCTLAVAVDKDAPIPFVSGGV